MPSGLVALLDDISVIARAAAASVDDIGLAASKAGTKAAGVVIDDAAVTPGYVTGLSPDRELPIVARIVRGSLINKLVVLLPVALLLSEFLPQAVVPLLMLGGLFLAFEGAEKAMEKLGGERHGQTLADPISDVAAFEKARVAGAIRTDLILSAEIMAITLGEVAAESLLTRAGVLALVGVAITVLVYGAVALLVKMDDAGLHLARRHEAMSQRTGRLLLVSMPRLLAMLSVVGTAAMLWVGGGIVLHGMEEIGLLPGLPHLLHDLAHHVEQVAGGATGWLANAFLSALFGLALGVPIALGVHKILQVLKPGTQ